MQVADQAADLDVRHDHQLCCRLLLLLLLDADG